MRIERDLLGEKSIEDFCYYGINTARAIENFSISKRPIHKELIRAMVTIKKAAAITNSEIGALDENIAKSIVKACDEILSELDCGKIVFDSNININTNSDKQLLGFNSKEFNAQFSTDALQGGAGTSANMNVNEVIANRAIELLGGEKGDYGLVHPLNHVNLHQSTNDVFPSAVRIAAIRLLLPVVELFAELQTALQEKEEEFAGIIKVGRTQLQDAVPITLGQEFGAWAQAIARDRWRLYKVEERLRQINLGGTAVGTGINAEKKYIFKVIEKLRELTGLGLARSEYMMDTTQNVDVFVEVSGLLKTAAVNLSKIASDLRLLASGPRSGIGEIRLPEVQAGSTIMPGKVNPVIPEAVNQVAFQIIGCDATITIAAQAGQLELNPFVPVIAKNLFEILELLGNILPIFIEKCIKGIEADKERCNKLLDDSNVVATALTSRLGYDKVSEIVKFCIREGKSIKSVVLEQGLLEPDELEKILNPYFMTSPR